MTTTNLAASIEALLFASAEPFKLSQLVKYTGATAESIEIALAELDQSLNGHGIALIRNRDAVQLVTAPDTADLVAGFLEAQVRSDLSQPALETLAIVAYHQPVTRSRVDELRGVASEQTLRNLTLRGLIAEHGKSDAPGRPILYGTTAKFLQHFGLKNASELPPLEEL